MYGITRFPCLVLQTAVLWFPLGMFLFESK
jgi:hypothetical protein